MLIINQALKLVIDVAFGLVVYALILRFAMQAMRAPFRNPLGQATMALTDWAVKPLRRIVPGMRGYDWATFVAAFVLQVLWIVAIFLLFGAGFDLLSVTGSGYVALLALVKLCEAALWILIIAVFAQAILSWVAPDGPLSGVLNALTFPLLRPLRKRIPPLGGTLDLTPLIVIVLAQIVLLTIPRLEAALAQILF
ncbi:MAG TPA: YggT family protein [Casimicrobiaceae bacterium]|jgi:YggT family protein